MDKSYRIHTNISRDTVLNVNMQQDYDFLEVLSLKLRQKDAYKLHSSNYGVIIGRVLANDAFGIPNARISVFIERDSGDTTFMESIYPYTEVTSKDREGRRYNLLPDSSDDDCYRIVGTFPNKRLVLDDDTYLEIFDKYWKYSTVTNNAGDYMIFGVPSGSQQIHVDLDLSDIGILSQKPRDFEYKGYNVTMFDNPSQFKESTNLDSLAQIFSQNKSVFVYPFWGDADNGIAAITRSDIEIQYKFEPTCVFMGSIVSDNDANAIGHKCAAGVDNGMNDQLVAGQGTIEMIRKTTDGLVEEFQIQGNQLIDEDGVWCYQIPMNLDYVGTDEYGNIVPTDNPNKGIPTRTQVRFRISKNETGDEGFSRHTAKYLVPMNPTFAEHSVNVDGKSTNGVVPVIETNGQDVERMYTFGSNTPQSCFRDLYWNNVYSVKNYIPKVQVAHRPYSKNYSALKGSNLAEDQNPIPYNKLRVDIPFMYMIVCILFTIVMYIVAVVNAILSVLYFLVNHVCIPLPFGMSICPFKILFDAVGFDFTCISLGGGLSEDNTAFYPGCSDEAMDDSSCPKDMEGNCKKRSSPGALMDLVQQRLAEDYKIIKLDLYQDWINGCLYMPLWYWRKRKKKSFLFGLFTSSAKNDYCSCDKRYSRLKTYVTCNVQYNDNSFGLSSNNVKESEDNWHRSVGRAQQVRYKNGIIKEVENKDGLKVYYYTALQATTENNDENLAMDKRNKPFYAVRLYATDIILLGNLNENNLYGIPQFFKVLPSTTANIPPIATIQEQIEDDTKIEEYSQNEVAGGEESGTTITTGMDWGRNGYDNSPQYKDGLFMDLSCTYAHTKAKSCFNVERISELGVNLDMTYNMSYAHNASEIQVGLIDSDGFITKYELDDMENRAMFATMNHIGFVPQVYQDEISGYTTQVEDKNTGYLIPKFKYIYPVDFDGRMNILMERYKNGFVQATYDSADEAYITFRMGAESKQELEYDRIRHFYYNDGGKFEMPLYNNSYYFYFGINKGSTAIDKFNKLFYSECYKNDKRPFSYEIKTKGKSYCPSLYDCHRTQRWIDDLTKEGGGYWTGYTTTTINDRGYGYIRFTSDDIRTPFSYTLYDSNGVEVISESDMVDTDFAIGAIISDDGEVIVNEGGLVKYHDEDNTLVNNPYGTVSGLTNQVYVLNIIDSDGKRQSERINLNMDKITFEYVGQKLGTKFYNTDVTRIDYICNDENEFYGIIEITKFYIDTYEYKITSAELMTLPSSITDPYKIKVEGTLVDSSSPICNADNENYYVVFELYAANTTEYGVRDCLCDTGNTIPNNGGISIAKHSDGTDDFFYFDSTTNSFKFYVYQPNSFVGKIIQVCNKKELEENTNSEIMKIQNGKNFNTFLNTMPTRFIIGTTSDGRNAEIGRTSNFYAHKKPNSDDNIYGTIPLAEGVNGWFGVHQEESYQFDLPINTTVPRNRDIWGDFLTIGSDITNVDTRKNILRYKFNKLFKVSDGAYLTTSNSNTFRYIAEGGIEPILYRSVLPFYTNFNMMFDTYIYGDNNYISCVEDYPQVVGINYHEGGKDGPYTVGGSNTSPRFNTLYSNREYLGNYFAAFTKNGRYTSRTTGDCSISIMSLPNYAAVNLEGNWKRLGRDLQRSITSLPKAYSTSNSDGECNKKTQPYLRSLFVDRRLDYDLVIWGPSMGKEIRLHSIEAGKDKERPWKSARVSGWTYGGIEMSFDEEENIISATSVPYYTAPDVNNYTRYTTSDAAFAAAEAQLKILYPQEEDESDAEWTARLKTHIIENDDIKIANKRLEYSYNVDDNENNNAYTVYNRPENGNIVWVNRLDTTARKLFNKGDNDEDPLKQYVKTFYEAYINEIDIRQLFWSKFNYNRLYAYGNNQGYGRNIFEKKITDINDPMYDFYLFKHSEDDGFNDDFNRENITSDPKNYPTKRLIDVGNIRSQEDYIFSIKSCDYGMSPEVTDDGEIRCEVSEGDSVDVNIQFSNPIEFIEPNADNKDYANVFLSKTNTTKSGTFYSNFIKFSPVSAELDFRINKVASNDFDVYTERPFLIRVLDRDFFNETSTHGTDGITYLKSTSIDEPNGMYNGSNNIDTRINDVQFWEFETPTLSNWTPPTIFSINWGFDIFMPNDSIEIAGSREGKRFFKKNGSYLTSDDNDFYNIEFKHNVENLDYYGLYAFSVLVLRTYKGKDSDYLTRRIRTLETSSIYDTRPIYLKVADYVNGTEKATYVIKSTSSIHADLDVNGETQPESNGGGENNTETNDEPQPQSETVTGSATGDIETQVHTQVITFQMLNVCDGRPEGMSNQTFANFDMMGFTFKFTDKYRNSYYLTPETTMDTKYIENGNNEITEAYINFKLIFTQDMGILADSQWSNGAEVIMFAKTRDGFSYKLKEFNLSTVNHINTNSDYDQNTKTSKDSVLVFDGTESTKYLSKKANGDFIEIE